MNFMHEYNRYSRVNKFEKRRKNNKAITILMIIGSSLAILLIVLIFFTGKDDQTTKHEDGNDGLQINEKTDDETDKKNDGSSNSDHEQINDTPENNSNVGNNHSQESSSQNDMGSEINTEPIESTDDNIIEAYTGNWEPIGTVQEEPHTTQFNKETQDWLEMEEAIQLATGLEQMTTLWIGNGGNQKAIGTVSSMDKTNIYRVYLTWVTNEGWQPTKVEKLKEFIQP